MPFLNQWKGENDNRKYFMVNLHKKMLATLGGGGGGGGGWTATSWSSVGCAWKTKLIYNTDIWTTVLPGEGKLKSKTKLISTSFSQVQL